MARQEGQHPDPAQGLARDLGQLAERERESRVATAQRARATTAVEELEGVVSDLLVSLQGPWRSVGAGGEPGFNSGWQNAGTIYGAVKFFKDPMGFVHLTGAASRVSGTDDSIFTLPDGYRPPALQVYPAMDGVGDAIEMWVGSNGAVVAYLDTSSIVSLDCPPFRVF